MQQLFSTCDHGLQFRQRRFGMGPPANESILVDQINISHQAVVDRQSRPQGSDQVTSYHQLVPLQP